MGVLIISLLKSREVAWRGVVVVVVAVVGVVDKRECGTSQENVVLSCVSNPILSFLFIQLRLWKTVP